MTVVYMLTVITAMVLITASVGMVTAVMGSYVQVRKHCIMKMYCYHWNKFYLYALKQLPPFLPLLCVENLDLVPVLVSNV